MKKIKLFAIASLVFTLLACQSTNQAKVNQDRNVTVDTSQYKTFAWLTPEKILTAPVDINPVMKNRIDDDIVVAFEAKGYKLIESADDADFTISYTIGNRDKIKVDSYPTTYRAGFGWGRGYYGMGTETTVKQYTEGRLAIDVFDVKSKQPVWHGWAVKRITSSDKDDPTATIRTVVNEVIAQF